MNKNICSYGDTRCLSAQLLHWTAIGDSITYLNEHPDEAQHRFNQGYMTRVVKKLPHIKYLNKGYDGWTAGQIAAEIDHLDLPVSALYSVFLGTNDWWGGRALGTLSDYENGRDNDTFFASIRRIINKLRSLNRDARIILMTPLQRVDFVGLADMHNSAHGSYQEQSGQTLAQFAEAIIAIGQFEKLEVIDLYHQSGITHENMVQFKRLRDRDRGEYRHYTYPDFIGVPFNPEQDSYPYPPDAMGMSYDGLHPSDQGFERIAQMLIEQLKVKFDVESRI